MVCPYENAQDANQHLAGTIVMYDEQPVWVNEVFNLNGEIVASMAFLPRMNNPMTVNIFDPKFDAKGMGTRLGYCNLGPNIGAAYLSRIPGRMYKQGLYRNNLSIGYDPTGRRGRLYRFEDLLRRGEFVDTLMRRYPSYQDSLRMMEDDHRIPSVAFSPEFALERQELGYYLLLYKGERVAWGDPGNFKLPKHFKYLSELLNKYEVPHES